ncbi:MAG: hypothetical protein PUH91_08965, partial [Prevotella sp.]|nr:hypothetical protein [Prevotella sp.]
SLLQIFSKNAYSFKCVNCDSYAVVLIQNDLQRYEKKYLRQNLPPATIIIYDLLIKMNVYVSIQR